MTKRIALALAASQILFGAGCGLVLGDSAVASDAGDGDAAPSSGGGDAAPPATSAGDGRASDGGGASDGSGPVAAPLTVRGHVVGMDGAPLPKARVVLMGRSGAVLSDANGVFSFDGVVAPYDLALLVDGPGANGAPVSYAQVFRALRRSDPALPAHVVSGTREHAGGVSGAVTLPTSTSATNTRLVLAFGSPETQQNSTLTNPTTGGFDMSGHIQWQGPAKTVGSLFALEYTFDSANVAASYLGFARVDGIAVNDGQTTAAGTIPLSAVTTATLTGTVDVPAGMKASRFTATMHPTADASLLLAADTGRVAFSIPTPVVAGATFDMAASCADAAGGVTTAVRAGLLGRETGVAIASFPAVPALVSPAGGAALSAASPITWTGPNGVYALRIAPKGGSGRVYEVYTTDTRELLPDLSGVGAALAGGTDYDVSVSVFTAPAAVDDVARGVLPIFTLSPVATSPTRTATAAP